MNCINCGSDNTQRAEVIFDGGTNNINTTSRGVVGGIGTGGTLDVLLGGAVTANATNGIQQTVLAQKAAPPTKRKLAKWQLWVAFLGIVFWLIPTAIIVWVWYKNHQWNKSEWPSLYENWLKTWYCHKCGTFFLQP